MMRPRYWYPDHPEFKDCRARSEQRKHQRQCGRQDDADQPNSRAPAYLYDLFGRLQTESGSRSRTYGYTPEHLLQTVGGAATSTMVWDTLGNRTSLAASGDPVPYAFTNDITTPLPAIVAEEHDGHTVYYVREPSGALVARIDGPTTQYYHYDDRGSTLFLTGANGAITDKYTYDAWGNLTSHTGPTQQPFQYVGRFGQYTHYQDPNLSDLILVGDRFYNPEIGRYTQHGSPYTYAGNNPVGGGGPGSDLEDPDLEAWAQMTGGMAYFHAWGAAFSSYWNDDWNCLLERTGNGDLASDRPLGTEAIQYGAWETAQIVGTVALPFGIASVVDDLALNAPRLGAFGRQVWTILRGEGGFLRIFHNGQQIELTGAAGGRPFGKAAHWVDQMIQRRISPMEFLRAIRDSRIVQQIDGRLRIIGRNGVTIVVEAWGELVTVFRP